jgi:cell wall-associated NlpC family hydrolase
MSYAVVSTNLLDLRSRPDHAAERASQLLFGEPIRVLSVRKGFVHVRQVDDYHGWVDCRFLRKASKVEFARWDLQVNAVIKSQRAALYANRSARPTSPHFILYGTQVRVVNDKNGFSALQLPDGAKVYVKSAHIRPINKTTGKMLTGERLLAEARRFLGVPYLWGGLSPLGFDCSGLMKALFGAFGITLPRDTREQIKVGRKVDRDSTRTGDLLFFDRHVGLAIGRTRILHASRGGGGVRINALSQNEPAYRADLDRDFNQARRIL